MSTPISIEANRGAIREELQRILASPLFRRSRRCGPLLEYVVMETIAGRGESLKERSIGVAVFGRTLTYDTNEDPIVRTSAAEVRKRIAQYYHEAGHETEIRIELTAGSYMPEFRVPEAAAPAVRSRMRLPRRKLLIAAAVAAAAILSAMALAPIRESPAQAFWAPLLRAGTVILAMGDTSELIGAETPAVVSGPSFAQTSQGDKVGFVDGMAMARVAALLRAHGSGFEIRRAGSLTLQDMRRAPAVLIGEMNNPWAKLVEGAMRYRFVWDQAASMVTLQDRQHPEQALWQLNWNTPYAGLKEDRAIISRVVDPRTENAILVLAGCGRDRTAAAGEFVTEPKYLALLAARLPRGWSRKNLQVVLASDLINGTEGHPESSPRTSGSRTNRTLRGCMSLMAKRF